MIGQPVEGDAEDDAAGAGRPAQGALRLLKGVGVAAVLFSGYAALTAASHTTSISPNLEGVHARVSIGYLVIVELLAATGLLVAAMRLSRETGLVAEPPSDDVLVRRRR